LTPPLLHRRSDTPLLEGAQKSWRRLDGHNQKLVIGVIFNDGIEVMAKPTDRRPVTDAA
jgi:putative transposase